MSKLAQHFQKYAIIATLRLFGADKGIRSAKRNQTGATLPRYRQKEKPPTTCTTFLLRRYATIAPLRLSDTGDEEVSIKRQIGATLLRHSKKKSHQALTWWLRIPFVIS
jgi:hypothetical protein